MNMMILASVIAVTGLGLLIFCIYKLVAPSVGWKYEYHAFIPQVFVEIPKAGSYDICVSHDRLALFKGRPVTTNWDWFPQADFAVARMETQEPIPYHRTFGMTVNGTRSSKPVGYFNAPAPGQYLVTNLFTYRFDQDDEIRIRKHQSFLQSLLCIVGIVGSSGLFVLGNIFIGLAAPGIML